MQCVSPADCSLGDQSILTYIPEPHEQAYYDALFAVADENNAGKVAGASAVRFFCTSQLPLPVLKYIWKMADKPSTTHSLDREKFAVAIRLVQFFQNNLHHKLQGHCLESPPGVILEPAMFEGISGVTIPLPPHPFVLSCSAPPAPDKIPEEESDSSLSTNIMVNLSCELSPPVLPNVPSGPMSLSNKIKALCHWKTHVLDTSILYKTQLISAEESFEQKCKQAIDDKEKEINVIQQLMQQRIELLRSEIQEKQQETLQRKQDLRDSSKVWFQQVDKLLEYTDQQIEHLQRQPMDGRSDMNLQTINKHSTTTN